MLETNRSHREFYIPTRTVSTPTTNTQRERTLSIISTVKRECVELGGVRDDYKMSGHSYEVWSFIKGWKGRPSRPRYTGWSYPRTGDHSIGEDPRGGKVSGGRVSSRRTEGVHVGESQELQSYTLPVSMRVPRSFQPKFLVSTLS